MINRAIFLTLAASFAITISASAQTTLPSPAVTSTSETSKAFDPAEATKAWLATVPADKRAKSDAYFEGGYWLILWNALVGAGIAIFLLTSGISARMRDFTERLTQSKTFQVGLYATGFVLLVAILSFPLTLYQEFYREHQYGFATQTFRPWFVEQLIGLVLTLIASTIALTILYSVFRHAPRIWWLWGTLVAVVLSFIGNFIAPIYVEPLFNTYNPLTDAKIRDPLKQCTLPEIRAVMAHEMGHYVLNHGAKLTIYFGVVAFFGFGIARKTFDWALRRWGQRWDVRGIADPAGFPLLMLIFVTFAFLMTPVLNSITRITEREADQFGINTSREPDGMAKVALKLGAYRKLDPTPLEEFIFFDHPSGRARIRMAMDWKAAYLPAGNLDAP